MKRLSAPAIDVDAPPRHLLLPLEHVWSTGPTDPWPERLDAAATGWRGAARAAGATAQAVGHALPASIGRHRPHTTAPEAVTWHLERRGLTTADLPAIAREARAAHPELFAPDWQSYFTRQRPR